MPDSNSSNGEVLTQVLKKMRSGEKIAPSEFQDFVKAQNDGATTGLKVAGKYLTSRLPIRTVIKEAFMISQARRVFFWSLVEAPIGDPIVEASSWSWNNRAGLRKAGCKDRGHHLRFSGDSAALWRRSSPWLPLPIRQG